MELDKLFEAIDSEILTDDMKNSLQESFETAVEIKAAELVTEQVQKEKDALVEEYEEKMNEYREESTERISEYLELVVEEYLKSNKVAIDESIKTAQVDALFEGFDSMIIAGGVDLKNITEATDDSVQTKKLAELTEKVDSLVESNSSLKAKNKELLKMGLVKELSEGLSLVEADKFEKLAGVIAVDEDFAAYIEKLETLKESVSTSDKEVKKEIQDEVDESLNESEADSKPSWSRFA